MQYSYLFLFKDTQQLEKLFDYCGLRIKKQLIKPYEGKMLEESLAQLLAIRVAYVLGKK